MKHNWGKELFPKIVWFQEGPGVRNTQYRDTGVKLLNVANLVDSHVDLSTSNRYISEEEAYGKYKHFLVDDGDFIIASSGIQASYFHKKMGFINKTHLPLCMNTSTIRFKVLDDSKLNIYFFQYYLKSFDFNLQLQKALTGCAQLNFGPSHLKKMKCPLPPMVVQEHIVAELDKINETIEDCRELLRNLDALAQSLFYDTFGDPITNPKGWEMKHFKEILYKIGSGATPKGGKQSYQGGNISLIRSLNVYNTYFKYDDLAKINANQAYELRNVEVQFDDVLLNITGASVARCFIVPKDTLPARVNQHVAILRPNNKFIRPKFLHRLIITPSFQNFLIGTARGKSATREALPKATLEMIKIPVPPISLQEQFAARIEQIEEQKKAVEQTIAELQTLLDSRMDYWFN